MERVGPSETKLLIYLSENPYSRHGKICTALNEDKSNITNRLKQLGEKNKKLVESKNKEWKLTEKGIITVIQLGGDVHTIIRKYWWIQPWVKQLKMVDDVLTDELTFWSNERNQVMGQLFLSLDAITNAGVIDPTVIQFSIAGVFKSYIDKNIKAKKMKGKQVAKIGKKIAIALGGLNNALEVIGFDYHKR